MLPAKTILLFISMLCAVLFIYNIRQRGWILPALSFGILVISALVIGGLYPTLIQYFSVRPNESVKEEPYIARNITATRAAYGIDNVEITSNIRPAQNVTAAQVAADKGTIPNTRLLDPVVLSKTYEQLQQIRSYYGFPPTLDIDRYTIDGKTQDYVVAVRELDQAGLSADQRNWINLHLNYTHGKGFVAAPANNVDDNGRPDLRREGPAGDRPAEHHTGPASTSASSHRTTRSSTPSKPRSTVRARARPATERPGDQPLRRHRRGLDRVHVPPRPVRAEVRREEHPAVQRDHEGFAHPLRAQSARPRAEGGAVADAGR